MFTDFYLIIFYLIIFECVYFVVFKTWLLWGVFFFLSEGKKISGLIFVLFTQDYIQIINIIRVIPSPKRMKKQLISGQKLVTTDPHSRAKQGGSRSPTWCDAVCAVFTLEFMKGCRQNSISTKKKTKKQKHVLPQTRASYTIQGSLTHTDRKENSTTVSQPVGKNDTH